MGMELGQAWGIGASYFYSFGFITPAVGFLVVGKHIRLGVKNA